MATQAKDMTAAVDPTEAMAAMLKRQRAAFYADLPVPARTRIDRMDRAIAILVDHQDALAQAMAEDFAGRPKPMSLFTDVASSIKALKFAKKRLKRWMKPEKRGLEFPLGLLGAKARVEYQPKGVVGLISPWNFPVNLTFGPLAGIFAAGNRVMIKPSEATPVTSERMKTLFAEYYDEEEVAVFTGGPDVGRAFTELPFDHILFTGATAIGRHVMRAAADNLTPVTLELGGKSPVILSDSADLDRAAERVVVGKMMNAGQICLAPDYMLVPEDKVAAVADALAGKAGEMYPTLKGNPDYTAIIDARHKARLEGHIKDAEEKGAKVRQVNPGGEDFASEGDNAAVLPLHILTDVHDDMTVMQEEIFGPVLPLVPYGSLDEAIDFVNHRPRPLGLYYFGEDADEESRVLERTVSGGVTVNDVIFHVSAEDLPFGGIGPSGMGAYHGREGFKTFSHAKPVYRQTKINLVAMIGAVPPYGDRLKKTLGLQIKK